MGNKVIRYDDQVIVITVIDADSDPEYMESLYLSSIDLATSIDGPVYRIVDLRQAQHNFDLAVSTIRQVVSGIAGCSITPDLAITFVGVEHMADTFTGRQDAFFVNMADALAYVRSEMSLYHVMV